MVRSLCMPPHIQKPSSSKCTMNDVYVLVDTSLWKKNALSYRLKCIEISSWTIFCPKRQLTWRFRLSRIVTKELYIGDCKCVQPVAATPEITTNSHLCVRKDDLSMFYITYVLYVVQIRHFKIQFIVSFTMKSKKKPLIRTHLTDFQRQNVGNVPCLIIADKNVMLKLTSVT